MARQREAALERENAAPGAESPGAFLNIPYDSAFEDLYLAYIAGISAFRLAPRATLEIPGGEGRRDRVLELIQSCRYSFHDLSRVEVDVRRPATPRFNMPFELGLATGWARWGSAEHTWFVLESKSRRVLKSLSDLSGTDVYVHDGRPRGVFRELCNALVRTPQQPTLQQMDAIYRKLKKSLASIMGQTGAKSAFEARVFVELRTLATALARARRWAKNYEGVAQKYTLSAT